jgi:NADH:ubiquinone oxidoreductase subunit E
MSNEQAKFLNSRRRHKNDMAVARQVKIAKAHGLTNRDKAIKEPHRLAKHHAMDCGNTHCYLCGNPRKTHKDKLTAQEKRLFQDLDNTTDKHSNGLGHDDQDS